MSATKQRHEQRKVERARRRASIFRNPQSAIRNGAAALAAAAVIAAGTTAYADPVRFDNPPGPGHYEWGGVVGSPNRFLDITLPATSQASPDFGPTNFGHTDRGTDSIVETGGDPPDFPRFEIGGPYDSFVVSVEAGELIPSGALWGSVALVYYPGFGSQLPEGLATYLGASFDLGAGNQYGWIGVVRTGLDLDAFAWGYETEPGVPIPAGVPEPGSLALLAFGAAAALRRRR